jgi:hypothetical protein
MGEDELEEALIASDMQALQYTCPEETLSFCKDAERVSVRTAGEGYR